MNNTKQFCYDYPRPAVSTDVLLFNLEAAHVKILLIKRKNPPFQHHWAFPGGFLEMDESGITGAKRELKEETGVDITKLKHFGAYSDPDRDPRGRMISLAYVAMEMSPEYTPSAADDAADADWFDITELPSLAFDHQTMLNDALAYIKQLSISEGFLLQRLTKPFTLNNIYHIHKTLVLTSLSFIEFKKACSASGLFEAIDKNLKDHDATLYTTSSTLNKKTIISFYHNII